MKPKTIMTVQELLDSFQKMPKDNKVYLGIVPLKEEAGIVGVQSCQALNFETQQMEPVVFLGIKNFSALAQSKIDANTFNASMILKFINNWDCYNLNQADIPESRLIKFNEIMSHRRQDPQSFNVERELASWLANFDDQTLASFIQFVAQKSW